MVKYYSFVGKNKGGNPFYDIVEKIGKEKIGLEEILAHKTMLKNIGIDVKSKSEIIYSIEYKSNDITIDDINNITKEHGFEFQEIELTITDIKKLSIIALYIEYGLIDLDDTIGNNPNLCSMEYFLNMSDRERLFEVVSSYLQKLSVKGNTLFITDQYLLSSNDNQYKNYLINLFRQLEPKKIVLFRSSPNMDLFNEIQIAIQPVEIKQCNDNSYHDRFWLCPETKKGVVIGCSLNNVFKKAYIKDLDNVDTISILSDLDDILS